MRCCLKYYVSPEVKKLYLSAILDLYDRRIIAYKLGDSNNNELVFTTFDEAISLYPDAKPIFHNDREFQYANIERAYSIYKFFLFFHCLLDRGHIISFQMHINCKGLPIYTESPYIPFQIKRGLFLERFLNRHSHGDSHADHGVVAGADQAHHLHMSGDGG